jgi:hypothetical protein
MKATTIYHPVFGVFIIAFLIFCFVLPLRQVHAQNSDYSESSEQYSREELAQMLAPIALYPDALLSQVLMASTYPIEVIEADRWIRKNPELNGEALNTALLAKDWDPSIKAICHFPSILALMSERITETTNLGNAFLAQEAEVMDMVQELRAKAYAQGNLTTNANHKVIVEKETIIIRPADYRIIHVPYYDPFYIYGPWWYPAYRPHYWGPPGVSIGISISYWPGFYFGSAFGAWSYFDWSHRYIYIDVHKRPRFVRNDRWIARPGRWQHAPSHRRGVVYRDKFTAKKYGRYPNRSRNFRHNTRNTIENRTRDFHRRGDDRTKINRERQKRKQVNRDREKQTRIERNTQERTPRDRQKQTRIKRDGQGRVDRDGQEHQRVNPERQKQKSVEYGQQQSRPDKVFNRIEDGKRGGHSSKGGRVNRQGMDDDFLKKHRSGGDNRRGHGGGNNHRLPR